MRTVELKYQILDAIIETTKNQKTAKTMTTTVDLRKQITEAIILSEEAERSGFHKCDLSIVASFEQFYEYILDTHKDFDLLPESRICECYILTTRKSCLVIRSMDLTDEQKQQLDDLTKKDGGNR